MTKGLHALPIHCIPEPVSLNCHRVTDCGAPHAPHALNQRPPTAPYTAVKAPHKS